MRKSSLVQFGFCVLTCVLVGCTSKENVPEKVKVPKKASARPGELLHFDFEEKISGKFANCANQLYYGKITGEPELVEGKNGKGLFFSKPKQSVKIRGLRKLPFGSFDCEFEVKLLKSGSKGFLLYGPGSHMHNEGFGISLNEKNFLGVTYSTKNQRKAVLISNAKLPLNKFVNIKVVYDDKIPSLAILQDDKTVAEKKLEAPILFNSRGAQSMRIGTEFSESPLNIVLDEFKFIATSKPAPKLKRVKNSKVKAPEVFMGDRKEFKGGNLTVKFLPARDYGIPEKELFYSNNKVVEDGKPPKTRMLSTELGFTGKPYNRFMEDEKKEVVLEFHNESASPKSITLKTSVDDWCDRQVWEREKRLTIPPKGKIKNLIDLETKQKGCFFIKFSCLENGKKLAEYNSSYAITVNAAGAVKDPKTSPFGQHYHDGFWNGRKMQEVSSNWIRYFRYGAGWADIELTPGKYDWNYSDKALDYLIDKRKFNVMYNVNFTPHFYSTMPLERYNATNKYKRAAYCAYYPPKNLEAWKKWLRAMVKRRKGKVKCWEIWNEVNAHYFQGSVEDYFKLLKCAYETIKSEDPEAIVAAGALTSNFIEYAKRLFKLGGHKYMDVLTVHYYLRKAPEKEVLLPLCTQIREVVAKTGKELPIWDGESSYCVPLRDKNCRIIPVPYGVGKLPRSRSGKLSKTPGERRAAAYSIRQRIIELGMGVERFFTFNQYAMPPGAFTLNLVAREAMVKNLGDKKFNRKLDLGAKHLWGYLFSDSGNTAVLWSTSGEQDLILNCDAEKVIVSDFLGNSRESSGGKCKITLSDYPVYILDCGSKISVGSELFSFKAQGDRALIGDNYKASISNRMQDQIKFDLSILDALGKKVGSTSTFILKGDASKELNLPIAVTAMAGTGEISIVTTDSSGESLQHSLPVKLAPATIKIPKIGLSSPVAPPTNLKSQILLENEDQVKIGLRNPAVMETVPHWKGVNDVSAKAALAWNPKGLYLAVDVTDDKFLPNTNKKPWLNDAIELYLDLRTPPGESNYGPDVFHYIFCLLPNGEIKLEDYAPAAGRTLKIDAIWEKSSKGYRVFAFINLPAKYKLNSGREIGFDLAIDDADPNRNDNKRVSQLIWRGAGDNHLNASLFGIVKLVDSSQE